MTKFNIDYTVCSSVNNSPCLVFYTMEHQTDNSIAFLSPHAPIMFVDCLLNALSNLIDHHI